MADDVCTTCPYCGVGCGLVVSQARDGWAIGADPAHPANLGRLCSKGAALIDTVEAEDIHPAGPVRLLHPSVDGRPVDWPEAIEATATRLKATMADHGPGSVAFYVSGQLLTEDYYVANKLLKGFIGSPHIDTNSRLCMASTVAGHKRAFGADVVPGCYEDLELADLVVLTGSNLAWCHPVLNQRLRKVRRDRGTRVVVIDPRRTATCDDADLHLPLKPGSDVTLFNGLLVHLAEQGVVDLPYVRGNTGSFDGALAAARAEAPDIASVAAACALEHADVARFYAWFADTPRTVTAFSQGVNQSSSGTDKVNAILNVHLATGRIGKPGASPFSLTGQPNAMGGREVGGLANQLAAHMNPDDPEDVARLRRFWKAPALRGGQGLKAVDLFRAIDAGEIKALWVMGTNPAVSLPEGDLVRRALAKCPTVVVSDVVAETDTLAHAHIRLPAAAWGEKDGTVTNSERRISRQRPFRRPPGQARADWWIMTQVARAMGYAKAFGYSRPAEIFREHARLSAYENDGRRAFDIGGLARLSNTAYEALKPVQWPLRRKGDGGTPRIFGDGRFATVDGRGHFIAVTGRAPAARPDIHRPLIANTGRYRDQWHTMTRTGLAERLAAHRPEPLLEISPADAQAFDIRDDGLAEVTSAEGRALFRVRVTDDQPQGQVFLPMHWSDSLSAAGSIGRLIPGHVDPVSGQPESKAVPISVSPWAPAWQGVLMTRRAPALDGLPYWVRQNAGPCLVFDLAGETPLTAPIDGTGLEVVEYHDPARGVLRQGWMDGDGALVACLFVDRDRPAMSRDWVRDLFDAPLSPAARADLLAGRAADGAPPGDEQLVCSCAQVSRGRIIAALTSGAATTAEDVGRLLGAGAGCGSCGSEIAGLVTTFGRKQVDAA